MLKAKRGGLQVQYPVSRPVCAVRQGSDDKAALEIADAVNEDIINHADCMDLIKNALDALGKGFSVNEIIWDTSGSRWKPETFMFRDPRWFAYDKESGVLSLRDVYGLELHPLEPYKFIVHEPNLLSGKQITSGLSFTALFYWLVKTYDVTSWAAFADRFGYPVRLGKYGQQRNLFYRHNGVCARCKFVCNKRAVKLLWQNRNIAT